MKLTEYFLVHVMEECSELQKVASKILRFGLTDSRKRQFVSEFEDVVMVASQIMDMYGLWSDDDREAIQKMKLEKQQEKLKEAIEGGTIDNDADLLNRVFKEPKCTDCGE